MSRHSCTVIAASSRSRPSFNMRFFPSLLYRSCAASWSTSFFAKIILYSFTNSPPTCSTFSVVPANCGSTPSCQSAFFTLFIHCWFDLV